MPAISSDTTRLAVVLPSWIGDTVMATPVLRAARAALPQARLVGIMRPGLEQILAGTPWLDELVKCDTKRAIRLGASLRGAKPQAVLLLPNSFRSALGARFSSAKVRAGYARDGRGWLLTHGMPLRVAKRVPISAVDYYAELAEWALGQERIDRRVRVFVTAGESAAADKLLEDVKQPFALLNPGANRADKRWPAERFAKLAQRLAVSRGLSIVINGSPKERDVLQSIHRAAECPVIDLSTRGSAIGTLKAVIQRAAVVVTNDTGPRHIAAALGTPVVTLFGPTDHRWTTLHEVRERRVLAEPFLPEDLAADLHGQACAIDKISVHDVLAAVESLLRESKVR